MINDNLVFLKGTIWNILIILLFFLLAVFLILKYVIPYLKNKKWIQFSISLLISIIFFLMTIYTSTNYISLYKEYLESRDFYIYKAKVEIENDLIDWSYYGLSYGMLMTCAPEYIDSVSKSYGVNLKPARGVYDNSLGEKARDKYYEYPRRNYLDKRNGVGWEKRMDEVLRPYIIDLMKK